MNKQANKQTNKQTNERINLSTTRSTKQNTDNKYMLSGHQWGNDPHRQMPFENKYNIQTIVHCVSKRIPDITECNLKKNYQILIIFPTNIPDITDHYGTIQIPTSPNTCFCITQGRKKRWNEHEVKAVGRAQIRRNEIWSFTLQHALIVLRPQCAGALSCWKTTVSHATCLTAGSIWRDSRTSQQCWPLIPRLHDEAGLTSWLDELALRAYDELARRALVVQLCECLQYYTIQMTR